MEQSSRAVEGPLDAIVVPLPERLRLHIARMAPHQRERYGGALLIECAAELARLGAFANAVLGGWPDEICLDGFELQDHAVKHGLLALKDPKPTEPCGEFCNCVEYHGSDPKDWAQGVECYVKTALLGHNVGIEPPYSVGSND